MGAARPSPVQATETVNQQLRALADTTRREILRLVSAREMLAGEIGEHFRVSRPAISRHLRVLREARLVTVHRAGTCRGYRANPEAVADLRRWFDEFWETGLPRLKQLAEAEAKSGRK